jgi:hypothetical protein
MDEDEKGKGALGGNTLKRVLELTGPWRLGSDQSSAARCEWMEDVQDVPRRGRGAVARSGLGLGFE